MPRAIAFECPQCGASLVPQGDKPDVQCQYCGKVVLLPEELRQTPQPPPREPLPDFRNLQPQPTPSKSSKSSTGCGIFGFLIVIGIFVGLGILGDSIGGKGLFTPPTPTIVPISRSLDGTLPRQVHYANLQFNVTRALISNQPFTLSGSSRKPPANQAFALITMTITNPLPKSVAVDPGTVRLQLGDGSTLKDESGWGNYLDAQTHQEVTVYFRVPAATDWKGAKLILGEPGKEPATLPLDGQAPKEQYPIKVNVPAQVPVEQTAYNILSATLDLDADGKRADAGKRFLILGLRVTNNSTAQGGITITSSNFRLIVDSLPLAPISSPIEALYARSSLEGTVIFQIPAAVSNLQLQFGEIGHANVTVAVKMP